MPWTFKYEATATPQTSGMTRTVQSGSAPTESVSAGVFRMLNSVTGQTLYSIATSTPANITLVIRCKVAVGVDESGFILAGSSNEGGNGFRIGPTE